LPPQGGWKIPTSDSRSLPYASTLRQGRLKLDDVASQSITLGDGGCTIEEIEEDDEPEVIKSEPDVEPIAIVKIEGALCDPENDEIPLNSLFHAFNGNNRK